MAENDYKWIPLPGCICNHCVAARGNSAANHAPQPTDQELADAVRKSVQAMSNAVWAARSRGLTVNFNVRTDWPPFPTRAVPGSFVLSEIYRETTEHVPASTKTVRVNL